MPAHAPLQHRHLARNQPLPTCPRLLADHLSLDKATGERGDEHEAVEPALQDVPGPAETLLGARAEHPEGGVGATGHAESVRGRRDGSGGGVGSAPMKVKRPELPSDPADWPRHLNRRLRGEFIARADEDSRRRLGRGLTKAELARVLRRYPGDV